MRGLRRCVVWLWCVGSAAAVAQPVPEERCSLATYAGATRCAVEFNFYRAYETTWLLEVAFSDPSSPSTPPPASTGSAFLVDADRGWLLTSKHVVVGNRVWSTVLPPSCLAVVAARLACPRCASESPVPACHAFVDHESALEAHLSSPANAVLTLRRWQGDPPVPARLLALDRESDLALLAVDRNNLRLSEHPRLFQPLPHAAAGPCVDRFQVSAVGYERAGVGPDVKWSKKATAYGPAGCELQRAPYSMGGQGYQVLLHPSEMVTQPGFSGGPVLNADQELVGVVSGATAPIGGPVRSYFVPLSHVRQFLQRFR